MARPIRADIDLEALAHNFTQVRNAAPHSQAMAVVKANAYGHGITRVATALSSADGFGVACLEEAQALRAAGIRQPITLLEGFFEAEELAEISRQQLIPALHHPRQLEQLEAATLPEPVHVWLKLDTGMHRLGFEAGQAVSLLQRLQALPQVASVSVMSHLACADDRQDDRTERQLQQFLAETDTLQVPRSLANSGGLLGWPATRLDWVRPGLMLYGVSPFPETPASELGLRPVMTLRTRLIAVQEYPAGTEIGYGGSWVCPEAMPVGVAAVGYGDGYPRHAPAGTPVLVNGRQARLVGRVSMDMICIDLRDHPGAEIGSEVVLWGEGLPVENVATAAGTIPYELLCRVTARVPDRIVGKG